MRRHGFSLLELLIALVIIAVVVSLAIPSYKHYVQKVHRLDGQNKLVEIMQLQHRYFSRHLSYTVQLTDGLGLASDPVTGHVMSSRKLYRISAAVCNGSLSACIKLTATPTEQASDHTILTLDSLGQRTPAEVW